MLDMMVIVKSRMLRCLSVLVPAAVFVAGPVIAWLVASGLGWKDSEVWSLVVGIASLSLPLAGLLRVQLSRLSLRSTPHLASNARGPEAVGRRDSVSSVRDLVPADALVVLVTYAREDEEWRRYFEIMLAPLGDRGLFVWSDDPFLAGSVWHQELERAVARADMALVLVSPDLLASEFLMNVQLRALERRGVPLALVHVRASRLEAADVPAGARWLHDRDQPLQDVADPAAEIVRICQRLRVLLPRPRENANADASTRDAPQGMAQHVSRPARGSRMGDLHGVPPPAIGEIERDELAALRDALLREGDGTVGNTVRSRALGLHGQGGIGKTVLAAAVARDPEVRRHFGDGVYWVTVGEQSDVVGQQLALLERVGTARPELRSREAAAHALRDALAQRRCLLVIDDVWSPVAASAFDVCGPLGRVLYTTRDQSVLDAVGAAVCRVKLLSDDSARALLAVLTGELAHVLPPAADRILTSTGRVALALALVGAAIGRGRRNWDEVADELDNAGKTFLDHPYADVFKAMQVGVAALDARLAAAYRTLAVYPQDERVPVAAVARLWTHIEAAETKEQTREMLTELGASELLVLDSDAISFHDLQHEFLLLRAGDMRLMHADVLAAYQALVDDERGWQDLAFDEPYIWDHLLHHLHGAGDVAGVHEAVTDLAYMATRCARDGPYAAETDLRAGAQIYPGDNAIDWMSDLFTRWGYLLAGRDTPGHVAEALAIRAQDPPDPIDIDALSSLTEGPLLVPRWGLPDAPEALLRTLGPQQSVHAMAFSPDNRLATAGHEMDGYETVRLWDPTNGESLRKLVVGRLSFEVVVGFRADGTLVAAAGQDKTVLVWDSERAEAPVMLQGHTSNVSAVAITPEATLLATAETEGTVRLWDPESGKVLRTLGQLGWVSTMTFSPDGALLATAGSSGRVRLWDPRSGATVRTLSQLDGVTDLTFSPDGKLLATAAYDGVRLSDAASGETYHTLLQGIEHEWERHAFTFEALKSGVGAVRFSPDGALLATGGNDGRLRLWDPATGEELVTLGHTSGPVTIVVFSPDGARLATADDIGTVRVWDALWARRGSNQPGTLNGRGKEIKAVAFSPDGALLASASADSTVQVWQAASGEALRALHGHTNEVSAVAFSPDGVLVASAGDQTVRLWDPERGEELRTLHGHTGDVSTVAFSPDGTVLASGAADRTVRLWDVASGELLRALHGHTSAVNDVGFSTDSTFIASVGDRTVRLWDPHTGHHVSTLRNGDAAAAAFSPDGTLLATASTSWTVRLWVRKRGSWGRPAWGIMRRQRWANRRPMILGSRVAFSPDGATLAATARDRITLWDVATRTQLSHVRTGVDIAAIAWTSAGIALALGTAVATFEVRQGRRLPRPRPSPRLAKPWTFAGRRRGRT